MILTLYTSAARETEARARDRRVSARDRDRRVSARDRDRRVSPRVRDRRVSTRARVMARVSNRVTRTRLRVGLIKG